MTVSGSSPNGTFLKKNTLAFFTNYRRSLRNESPIKNMMSDLFYVFIKNL
jgi:hypothetical protein